MSVDAFTNAIAAGNCTGGIKLLDAAVADAAASTSSNGGQQRLVPLLLNRGTCYQRVQLHRKALKDFDEALACMPDNVLALYKKGQALAALKLLDDAQEAWCQALECSSCSTDVNLVSDLAAAMRDPSGVAQSMRQQQRSARGRSSLAGRWTLGSGLLLVVTLVALLLSGRLAVQVDLSPFGLSPTSWRTQSAAAANSTAGSCPVSPGAGTASSASSGPSSKPTSKPASKPATGSAGNPSKKSQQSKPPPSSPPAAAARSSQPPPASTPPPTSAPPPAAKPTPPPKPPPATPPPPPPSPKATAKIVPPASTSGSNPAGSPASSTAAKGPPPAEPATVPVMPAGMDPTAMIMSAVEKINTGDVEKAETLLNSVLTYRPHELGALVARGTARAMQRNLPGAIEDFGAAIELEPRYADSYKRRGQARSALGASEYDGALADLQKAIDLLPLWQTDTASSRAECYLEKGMVYQKKRDYRRACREVQQAVKLDSRNHQAWNVLGLCSVSQGDIRDGVEAYKKATEVNPKLKEAWVNMAQALKEEGRTKDAERAFLKVLALDTPDAPSIHSMRIMAQLKQQRGEHRAAIKVLDKVISYGKDEEMIECLYQRAICHHALGHVREAVRDYEQCLGFSTKAGANVSEEARGFQFLSFYQKEMALFLYRSLDKGARAFCLDAELSPLFKELWCKKGPPNGELISQYQAQPAVPSRPLAPPPPPDAARVQKLTALADQLGWLLQNNHQGFMSNMRQQRAAGYAAMELGQVMLQLLEARRSGQPLWVAPEGASGDNPGHHQFGWRDAMDIVVKWRQLAEPNDQVVWVDMLTRREFEQGFGSHTPMFSGQTKCVRYYMNFKRALELQKQVLLAEGHAFDAANKHVPVDSDEQQAAIAAAQTAEDMYHVIRQDTWVVVHIHAVHQPDVTMEGTRLTLVKVPDQPDAYEFSIRTPVTPPRWAVFDKELEACWENILAAMEEGDQSKIARAILTYGYYWYNFMPLARGTAAVGYATILSLFWTAGMPVTASIPKAYQVDWEAILTQHPNDFIDSLTKWMVPAVALTPEDAAARTARDAAAPAPSSMAAATGRRPKLDFPPMAEVPSVNDLLVTLRQRLEALNGPDEPRIG